MATSGSFTFDPTVAGVLDEAMERAGIDPSDATHKHLESAKRSLNFMFVNWSADQPDQLYRMEEGTASVISGIDYFDLATGAIDLIEIVMQYNGETEDLPLARVNRDHYLGITDKTQTGRPSLYYIDHTTLNAPRLKMWPVPDAACSFTYDYMRHNETVTALSETLDTHRLWLEAVVAGLAERLAFKFNMEKYEACAKQAGMAYTLAKSSHTGNNHVIISARAFGGRGRTLRR